MPKNPENPERPWFQLHLSTCIVLMVVAGSLAWIPIYFTEGHPIAVDGEPFEPPPSLIAGDISAYLLLLIPVLIVTAVACEAFIRWRKGLKKKDSA